MENLLLLVDELDDAVSALRHLLPKLLSFVAAAVLFAATGVLLLHYSYTVAGVVGGVAFCCLIIACERMFYARERAPLVAMLQRQLRRVSRS
jgi:hypothetical protein